MILLGALNIGAQSGISFYSSLDAALSKAKEEGKDVFLDTYAPWCKPCKKMDRVFRNKTVSAFFNEHFISAKINVDQPTGKEVATKYGIAFLPTMLILDSNGYVKLRIDGIMNAEQMLQIGESNIIGQPLATAQTTSKPISNKVNPDPFPVAEPEGKILLVLDGPEANENPEVLFHEAYFRLQKMNGSHDSIAAKYVETQTDWKTEKNLKFIVDFLDNTNSKLFDIFVSHKLDFQEYMGADRYRNTMQILVNNCLYRQIPRPTPERVEELFDLLYPRKSEKYTYQYLLKRYEAEENYAEFVDKGEEYLETLIQPNADLLFKLGKYKCLNANKKELKECVFRVEESIRLSDNPDFDQYLTLAKLYLKQGKEKKSAEAAEIAKELSLGDTEAQRLVSNFQNNLTKM